MRLWVKAAFMSFLAVVLMGIQAQARPGYVKVMVEPLAGRTGRPPAEVLARLAAASVKSYSAYTVIRVPESRRQEIESAFEAAGFRATIQDDWDSVFTPGLEVDTRNPRLPDSSAVLSDYPGGEGLYVVQFEAPLDSEWTDQISKAGLLYVSYIPNNAVVVYGSQSAVARLAAEPHIQWSSIYQPAFRAQPVDLASNNRAGRYVIQFVGDPSQTDPRPSRCRDRAGSRLDALRRARGNRLYRECGFGQRALPGWHTAFQASRGLQKLAFQSHHISALSAWCSNDRGCRHRFCWRLRATTSRFPEHDDYV